MKRRAMPAPVSPFHPLVFFTVPGEALDLRGPVATYTGIHLTRLPD